jgi:ferritin-like metal-binding protein YciE
MNAIQPNPVSNESILEPCRKADAFPSLHGGEYMNLISTHNVNSITSLYTLQMRYLLSTLNQIPKCLEELTDVASDQQLKEAFRSHLMKVGLQRERIDQILLELTSKVVGKKCAVTAALIATVEKIVRETDRGSVRDAWLVASAHKIEEFEIASYHAALQWALVLGYTYQASLLETTLAEERRADDFLCSIAERINLAVKAA